MSVERDQLAQKLTKEDKIKFIIEQEKLANNSWKWIKAADSKTKNFMNNYWTHEL